MVEVKAGHNEQRGLVQLRNQLVAFLAQRVALEKEARIYIFSPKILNP
jgi:hypothetical protein